MGSYSLGLAAIRRSGPLRHRAFSARRGACPPAFRPCGGLFSSVFVAISSGIEPAEIAYWCGSQAHRGPSSRRRLCAALSLAQRRRGGMASHVVRDRRMCRPSACAALRAAARWAHGVAREVGVGCVFALARSCFAGRARVLMDVGTRWPSVGLSAGSRPAVLRRPRDARDGSYSSRPVAGLPLCAVCFERPATAKDGITHVFEDSRRVSQAGYNGNRACGSRHARQAAACAVAPGVGIASRLR